MQNHRSGGAYLRAWRAGEGIQEAERSRRLEVCRAAGREPTEALSQVEAAALLGFSQSAYSSWETDEKTPRIDAAVHIEAVTGCPVRLWLTPVALSSPTEAA